MFNREDAKRLEMYLMENGRVGRVKDGQVSVLDALTGDRIDCYVGSYKGEPAVALIAGDDENLICLTLAYLQLVLDRSLCHTQLQIDGPGEDIPNLSVTMDPSSGVMIEAALITIEGEELIEFSLDNRVEPIVLEPGFLVELMLALYK